MLFELFQFLFPNQERALAAYRQKQKEAQPAAEQDVSKGEPKMDKQETARLLQMVRDKEKQRNADRKAKVTRIQSAPAGKDW